MKACRQRIEVFVELSGMQWPPRPRVYKYRVNAGEGNRQGYRHTTAAWAGSALLADRSRQYVCAVWSGVKCCKICYLVI